MTEDLSAESLLARLESEGVRAVCHAYRKQPIPSRILQELITPASGDQPAGGDDAAAPTPGSALALEFVAAYPLSPSHLLESLAQSSPPSVVLARLATNPRTPPQLLTGMAAHEDALVRAQVATHRQLPGRELTALAQDSDATVRASLAGNPSLRLPHQAMLVADDEPAVRLKLAGQPVLPTPVALVLGADDCPAVNLHTVATATVEDEILEYWAVSDDEALQLALLLRKNLPAEVCHLLLRSPHAAVRRQARADLDLDDVDLLYLITHGEDDERAWVAGQPLLPRPLQSALAQDEAEGVRVALAANPVLEDTIARYFVGLAEAPVCAALAANPTVAPELIEELAATRAPAVLRALAYREDLDARLVMLLLTHSRDFRGHWALQGRTSPTLDVETAQALAKDPLPTVRAFAINTCPDWRRADLYELARDPVPAVQIAALRHANAADEMLEDYANAGEADVDVDVAAAARTRQAERAAQAKALAKAGASASATTRTATAKRDAKAKRSSSHTDVDEPRANTSLADPPFSRTADTSPKRASAPNILHKLKRLFGQ